MSASSAWGSKGFKVVTAICDGCAWKVMLWDLRAFWQLELETLSHFCPLSGAALILEKPLGTSGCSVKSGHHEPAGHTTATQLDHQKTVPRSLPAICAPAKGKKKKKNYHKRRDTESEGKNSCPGRCGKICQAAFLLSHGFPKVKMSEDTK